MSNQEPRLLGLWRTDPDDRWSLQTYGDVSLLFEPDGKLLYTIHLPNRKQIMRLLYRVDGSWLITDQPSSPREERTEFIFAQDGRLVLKNPVPAPPTHYLRGDREE
jgi:hypothetical protein